MIKSLLYIRIAEQPAVVYVVPLLQTLKTQLPDLTTFEFDNFSEESIRTYAVELLKQSGKVAVVVESANARASVSGLSTFFNKLLTAKPNRLLLVLQGEQPMLQKMMQTIAEEHFYQNIAQEQLAPLLFDYFSGL